MKPALALCLAALLSACVSHDTREAFELLRRPPDHITPPLPAAPPSAGNPPTQTQPENPLIRAARTDEDAEEVLRRAALNLQILTQPN